jgi:hypothetical protein
VPLLAVVNLSKLVDRHPDLLNRESIAQVEGLAPRNRFLAVAAL